MELEEKEALGTLSTSENCDYGGTLEKKSSGQIEKGDMGERWDKGSCLRVECVEYVYIELEEGEVIEAKASVDSKDEERVFNRSFS